MLYWAATTIDTCRVDLALPVLDISGVLSSSSNEYANTWNFSVMEIDYITI